ncbi:hypothetical protein GR927_01340 [Mycolicibacterium sp. 3033]|nr:hypothetical protein [Mycolicibacterium aurantiacum]
MADDAQGELDLRITPKAVRAHMVRPPAEALFTDSVGVPAVRQLVVRTQVLKSSSRVLYGLSLDTSPVLLDR